MNASLCRMWPYSMALLAGLLWAAPAGNAAQSPNRADPGFVEDVQDVLFLHDTRPVLIRLHIFVDGKPYPVRWNDYLTRWFRFLDVDEDGYLDRKEAERAPEPRVLEDLLSNPYAYLLRDAPAFEEFDRDRDKRVSLDEFLRYYRSSSAGPIQLVPPFNRSIQSVSHNVLTEALYGLLDKNKDGKLARTEVEDAEKILRKFDADDDELLSLQELQEAAPSLSVIPSSKSLVPAMQTPPVPLLLVPREDGPRRIDARLSVARQVMQRYDKNKNKSLSREEIGMTTDSFDRLDTNKDGELDVVELLRWIIAKPDAEVFVRLGHIDDNCDPIAAKDEKNPALSRKANNTIAYSTPDHCVNLVAAASVPAPSASSARQVIIEQFETIDRKGKGFLTKNQLQKSQFYNLHAILSVADRNRDECLDLEELNAWLDLTTSGENCRISVTLAASGRGLFQLLDADQDGRLSLRELRTAWKRLTPYDRDHDDAIRCEEIPLQYQVVLNPGAPNYFAGQFGGVQTPPGTMSMSVAPRRGPLWFRKMDRNGDGDVSQREFLGSRDDFRRIDTDGDGLISFEEARRADAARRKN